MGQGWGGNSARSALLPPLDDGHLAHKRGGGWWPLHDHVQPGLNYFHRQISTNLKNVLDAFKAARLFSPYKVHIMQPTVRAVDSLSIFPFLAQQETLSGLKEELPAYLAKSSDIDSDLCDMEWWKMNCHSLPKWSAAVKQAILV